jgi:hypothetical protein
MRNWIVGTLAATALVLGASAVTAATLTATLSSNTANPGDVIVITLSGDPQGASEASALVFLETDAGVLGNENLVPDASAWQVPGTQGCVSATSCEIVNAFSFFPTLGVASNWGTVELDTTGLTAGSTVNLSFTGDPNLIYFGLLTDQSAGSVSIVPEPGTAAMLSLGLLGLGFAGRRHR